MYDIDVLDKEGYPTSEFLKHIKEQETDIENVFDLIVNAFEESIYGIAVVKNNKIKLITGGWSGNEDIINAMFENVFISICWCASVRGGVSIWDLREIVK